MSPLIKKALFRINKLRRPPIFGGVKKTIFGNQLRRGTIAAAMALFTIGIICSGRLPIKNSLNEGDVAPEDIYTPFSFSYEAGVNEEKTKKAKTAASESVLDVYELDSASFKEARADIERLFSQLSAVKKSGPETADADLEKLKTLLPKAVTLNDINILLDYSDTGPLQDEAIRVLKEVSSYPVISDETSKTLLDSKKDQLMIYQKATGKKTVEQTEELYTPTEIRQIIKSLLSESKITDQKVTEAIYKLIPHWIRPNLIFNKSETESAKREAFSRAPPVYNILERAKDEIIIGKGQRVTKDHITQLEKIGASSTAKDILTQSWGAVFLITILTFLLFGYLKNFEPAVFYQDKLLLLIAITILFAAASARIIVSSPLPSYFIPVAAVSMLLAVLVNANVASITVMVAGIIVALIAGYKFNIFLVSIVGGLAAVCSIYRSRQRGQIIKAGLSAGFFNLVTICSIGILSNFQIKVFLKESLWGFGGGMASAAITMFFLPFFESAFKITTDIRLLELSDLNHPLLKKMVTEAPGTYHHSMVVGNLSEAACNVIGANSLLARAGSYYHDIGKIEKAEYFAENQSDFKDTHNRLSPSMSSLIITNHVKDGVELAEKYNLGIAIKDIIEQHHGTGLVTYFYHQAIEKKAQQEEEKGVSEEGFRYPGPKPQAKEAAVVMLADSVEAASRVLQGHTPQKLKELVRKIINNKFIDRQLDQCDLTLEEINKIADSFVKILTGIYHSRVEYPSRLSNRHADTNSRRTKNNRD